MQLDTINILYLELSQVATATTAKELALKKELADLDAQLWPDGDKPDSYEPDRALRIRTIIDLAKKNASDVRRMDWMADSYGAAGLDQPGAEAEARAYEKAYSAAKKRGLSDRLAVRAAVDVALLANMQ